jgi:hypothetical protein
MDFGMRNRDMPWKDLGRELDCQGSGDIIRWKTRSMVSVIVAMHQFTLCMDDGCPLAGIMAITGSE